jgi:hypothetical protein
MTAGQSRPDAVNHAALALLTCSKAPHWAACYTACSVVVLDVVGSNPIAHPDFSQVRALIAARPGFPWQVAVRFWEPILLFGHSSAPLALSKLLVCT